MQTVKKVLTSLGEIKSGALFLAAAITMGWASHALTDYYFGSVADHEARLVLIETHDVAMMDSLENRWLGQLNGVDSLSAQLVIIEFMVHQLFCDKWPNECAATPVIGENGESE